MKPRNSQTLLAACLTVTRQTPRVRVLSLLRMLEQAMRRGDRDAAQAHYYLSIGTVPRSLWES